MNTRRLNISAFLLALLLPSATWAVSAEQHATIERLGGLNGIALQCQYTGEMKRMKKAMVDSSPKLRALGQAFEDATQRAFLAFIEKRQACTPPALFALQVDQAIGELQQSFGASSNTPETK